MEITTGRHISDSGKTSATVEYYEQIDGFGHSARIEVWFEHSDSHQENKKRALKAASEFLARALSAHSEQYPDE